MVALWELWFLFWSFIKVYVIAIPCLLSQIILKTRRPIELDLPVEPNTVAIVTGGARGIGFEISMQLARVGVHVIMGVNDISVAKEAIAQIQNEIPVSKVEAIHLNLCSFASVRKFAGEFLTKELPLHILINNAGVMMVPEAVTKDGYEEHLQVNYLSHYLLTGLLLPRLLAAGRPTRHARIVTMSSHVHYVGHVNMADLNSRVVYSSHAAYAQSKLALLLFASSLQRRLAGAGHVTANCVHPGVVDTDLFRHTTRLTKLVAAAARWMHKDCTSTNVTSSLIANPSYETPAEGAYTPLYLALTSCVDGLGGGYYDNCEKMAAGGWDSALEVALWEWSLEATGLPAGWPQGAVA